MTSAARRLGFALLFVVWGAACVRGTRAPAREPSESSADASPDGPFGVVFGAPRKTADETSEISLLFNRPVRPVVVASAANQLAPPARIEPNVDGAWRWIGGSG